MFIPFNTHSLFIASGAEMPALQRAPALSNEVGATCIRQGAAVWF